MPCTRDIPHQSLLSGFQTLLHHPASKKVHNRSGQNFFMRMDLNGFHVYNKMAKLE